MKLPKLKSDWTSPWTVDYMSQKYRDGLTVGDEELTVGDEELTAGDEELTAGNEEIGKMLSEMMDKPEPFAPNPPSR